MLICLWVLSSLFSHSFLNMNQKNNQKYYKSYFLQENEDNEHNCTKRHIKGYGARSDFPDLNCHGHNSNFMVVQVETMQEISQACRPLSQQTSESLYKKAENELLIFLFSFAPSLSHPPPVLSFNSLNEGQHWFPCHCHRDVAEI